MKKLLAVLLIFLLSSLYFPQKSQAQYVVIDPAETTKEYGLDSVAYIAAQVIAKKLTQRTVNWINNGFKGNPSYVQDPAKFFLEVGDNVASYYLSKDVANKLCTPFSAEVRLALVKNYIDDNENYVCTLGQIKNNYNDFINDFRRGGWDAWFEITQKQENNPLGSYLAAKNSLDLQVLDKEKQYEDELTRSGGFLNFKRCPKGAEYTLNGQPACEVAEETVTPGQVVSNQLQGALGSKWGQVINADEFNEIISALAVQLVGQMAGGVGGLFAASEVKQGQSSSLVDQYGSEIQPFQNISPSGTSGSVNCTVNGGNGGSNGNGGNGGSASCRSTPGSITGLPSWPLGGSGVGGSGGSCPAYTPDTSKNCANVDSGRVLSILNNYRPSNNGINLAIQEIQTVYPSAQVIPHPVRLDKIDFGNGMVVDVIAGAIGNANGSNDDEGTGWVWNVECACNRDPAGSTNPPIVPPPPTPANTYTLTLTISGLGTVTDLTDTCQSLSTTVNTQCVKTYPKDSFVRIIATPAIGQTFMGWTGACAIFNPGTTCEGNITADAAVTAIFQ